MGLVAAAIGVTGLSFLWPGLVLARGMHPTLPWRGVLLHGTYSAFILQFLTHAAVLLALGPEGDPDSYRWMHRGVALSLAAACAILLGPRRPGKWWDGAPGATGLFLLAVAVPTVLLFPRLVWQDFNPDGIELFTMAQSLSGHLLPRIPTGEVPGINLGMLLVAHPVDWIAQAMGASELAVRAPGVLYPACLSAAVATCVEGSAPRSLLVRERVLLYAGVLAVSLVLLWNTSYDPYSADLSSPASIDLLAMVFFVGTLGSVLAGERGGAVLGAALLTATRPTGLMLCGLLSMTLLVTTRGKRTRQVDAALLATLACIVVSVVYSRLLAWFVADPASQGEGDLFYRLRYLRFNDWQRLLIILVPSGLVPAFSLAAWRRHDQRDWAIILTGLGYGGFFFGLAFVALHHFAPVMLLPLIVFWRGQLRTVTRPWMHGAVGVGALGAIWLASPGKGPVFRAERDLGRRLEYRVGSYGRSYAGTREAFEGRRVLDSLLTPFSSPLDPSGTRLGSNWALIHYSATSAGKLPPDYIVQPATSPAPGPGWTSQGTVSGTVLYIRDLAQWHRDRESPPPLDPRSPLFDVPRTTLFRHLGVPAGVPQLDARALMERLISRGTSRAMPGTGALTDSRVPAIRP